MFKTFLTKSNIYFELRTFVMTKYGVNESEAETKFREFYEGKVQKPSITYLIDSIIEYSQFEGFQTTLRFQENSEHGHEILK